MCKCFDSQFDDWDDERDYLESDFLDKEDDRDKWVCLFPGQCCMPSEHTSDECHTASMAEEYFREAEADERQGS
jgi:hypothetical protein